MNKSMKEDLKRLELLKEQLLGLEDEATCRSYMECPREIAFSLSFEERQRKRIQKEIREITDWFMVWAPEHI